MSLQDEAADFDFLGAAMIENPWPGYELLRARGEVVWSQQLRSWLVVGYDAARTVLATPDAAAVDAAGRIELTAKKSGRSFSSWLRLARHLPTFTNGANHARIRRGMGASLGAFRDRFAPASAAACGRLLEPLRRAGGGDIAVDFAHRLHGEAAGELLGVPASERPMLARLAALGRTLDDAVPLREYSAADASIVQLCEIMLTLLREQRARGDITMLTDLARRFEPDPQEEPDLSVATAAAALLVLGRDTVSGALTLGVAEILDRHGGAIGTGVLDAGPAVVEEIIRIGSSVQYAKRQALVDMTLGGRDVKAGDSFLILVASANRDQAKFEDATAICPHRGGWSLAFGHGAHSCLGAPMGRVEVAAAFAALAALPGLRTRPGRKLGRSRLFRGYDHLPVSFD